MKLMLKDLKIASSNYTPEVHMSAHTGQFSIKGRSLPENINDFYHQLQDWLEEYAREPQEETRLDIFFEYYNSSTARKLIELIFILEDIHASGNKVEVVWNYQKGDALLQENGEEIMSVVELPFTMVEHD